MRIAILNLTAGGISEGYRKYLRNVMLRIAKHDSVEAIICVSPESLGIQGWFEHLPNVRLVKCKPFMPVLHYSDPSLLGELQMFSPDVIFIPVARCFHFNNIPVVNMLQNMEPFTDVNESNPIPERVKNFFRACQAKRAIKKADRVIAISGFVKEFLIKKWSIPESKIGLIYHGIDGFSNCDAIKPLGIPIDWNGKFIFTAGSIRPARGLEDVLLAMRYLNGEEKESVKLAIAGDVSPNMVAYQNRLKRWIEKYGLQDKVCWLGNLKEDEMSWCYKNCKVFVMSSRVESFGQIALEAMSYGCICISADNPCLPEIFKDAAVYYTPKDSQSLAKAIKSVLNWDSNQRGKTAEQAINRASEFSWDVCAKKTVEELFRAYKN